MLAQVFDPMFIPNTAAVHLILCPKTIFHYKQGYLIAIIEVVHGNAETNGINGPAPSTLGKIGVFHCVQHVTARKGYVGAGRSDITVIIAQANKINCALCERLFIPWLHLQGEDRKSTRLNSSHVRISYAV